MTLIHWLQKYLARSGILLRDAGHPTIKSSTMFCCRVSVGGMYRRTPRRVCCLKSHEEMVGSVVHETEKTAGPVPSCA